VISVGASTETEMKQTKARMEDALHATRAAVEEGILPGGGVALLRAIEAVKDVEVTGDEAIGVGIVARALEAPARTIANNCGKDGAAIVREVRQLKGNMGYDASKDAYVDMLEAGILDPAKVVRNALSNAASIAGLMLTSQVLVEIDQTLMSNQWKEPISKPGIARTRPSYPGNAENPSRMIKRSGSKVSQSSTNEEVKATARVAASESDSPEAISWQTGEIAEVMDDIAICWMDVAPGVRVRTEVPIASMTDVSAQPDSEFTWKFTDDGRTMKFAPLRGNANLDAEFNELSQRFLDEHSERPLPNDF
jgi:hypothetical protein